MTFRSFWNNFARHDAGSVAMTFSIAIPVMLGAVAVAVDSASLFRMQGQIQSIADSTALATAKEIAVYGAKTEDLEQVGEARAHGLLEQSGLAAKAASDVTVDSKAGTARVNLSVVGRSLAAGLGVRGKPDQRFGPGQIVRRASALCVEPGQKYGRGSSRKGIWEHHRARMRRSGQFSRSDGHYLGNGRPDHRPPDLFVGRRRWADNIVPAPASPAPNARRSPTR
jgi:Flp pilus assembly protein TadG